MTIRKTAALLVVTLLAGSPAYAQTDVLVSHYDLARTGQNLTETALTNQNVNVSTFGKLYSYPVDGYVYAQPLVKSNLTIPGKGTFNVVFVATQHGGVYALDADSATPIWRQSFINPALGLTPRPADTASDIIPEISITSTPVIDPVSGTLYVVAETQQAGSPAYYYLHALDITSGADKVTPTRIQAAAGAGVPALSALASEQRPGLVLSNGVVYVAFGSNADAYPWVGWLLGYDATTLAQVSVLCLSGDGAQGAGLWSSGEAPPVDPSGNLYLITGNGTFNGTTDWGNAILKVTPTGGLVVSDYFAPFNQAQLGTADLDLASAGITVLPASAGTATHPHLLLGSGKDGEVYLLDRDNLGHYNPSVHNTQIVQWLPNAVGTAPISVTNSVLPYVENSYTTPAFWQNRTYFCGVNDVCKLFTMTNGLLSTQPTSQAATTFAYPGASSVISAASSTATSAIMWVIQRDTPNNAAVLRAYDATNLANELYDSYQAAAGRDTGGPPVKFAVPTIANGKVFVGAQRELDVYGLLASSRPRIATPVFAPAPGNYPGAQSVTLSAASGSTIYYTLDGSLPTLASAVYTGPIPVSVTTTINAMAVQSGSYSSPVGAATYAIGSTPTATYVQSNFATPQSALTSVAVKFTGVQQQGDLNVVVVGWNDSTATVGTVTDSSGNVYQLAVGPTIYSGKATQSIYYATNIASAGAGVNTVTVTFNGAASYPDVRILEYSGVATTSPVDVTAALTGNGTLAASGPATTTNPNDLIFGADLVGGTTKGAGPGFTSRLITAPDGDNAEDEVVTSTGSYAATAPTTSSFFVMQMVAFKLGSGGGTAPPPAPTAPTNLAATTIASYEIDLTWTASTEAGGTVAQYIVERCPGAGCTNFGQVGTAATTSYRDQDTSSPLSPSTTYTYRVRAQDTVGNTGPYSNLASATTLGPVAPTAPGTLQGSAQGPTQVTLTWTAATESGGTIARYLIDRRVGLGRINFAQVATTTALTFTDTGLTPSTSYGYEVRAQDTNGNVGPYSSIVQLTTPAATPTAPGTLTAMAASGTQINLSWGAASESGGTISGYLIERCQGSGCSTFTQVGSSAGTSYSDTSLPPSTGYSYRVRATDAASNTGPYSNTASATTLAPSATPITFVQQNYATPQSLLSSVAVPFKAAEQAGDLNVVVVGWNDSMATVGTVTDSSGNVYQLAVGPTIYSGAMTQAIYYAMNIVSAAAGANTVTVSFSGSATYPDVRILEYSGVAASGALDVTAAATGNSALASSGAATTSNANDLIFGAVMTWSHATGAGAGFTSRVITAPDGDDAEDEVVTNTGSYTATVPVAPGKWLMQMAAFKSVAGGGTPTPTAPTGLAATAASSSQINLSWGAASETGGTIAQYLIERCQGSGCSSFAQIGTSTTLSFGDTGLTASSSYSYRVRAQDAANVSGPYSNVASATTLAAISPTAPGNLQASASGPMQISLSWTAATESGGTIAQYLIERCQGSGCSGFIQIGASTTLSFADSGLTGSTSYSYRVRAQDSSAVNGPYSNIASAMTAAPVLTAPGTLTAVAASGSQINLSWGAASETGGIIRAYLIERCQGSGCSTFAQVGSTAGTSYNDTGLTAGTTYSYRVRATDAANNTGPYSNIASATTAAGTAGAIAFVQKNYATPQSAQSSVAVPFTAAQQAGDLNVVVVGWNDSTATVGTVTDSSGNVYQLAVGPTLYSGVATQAIYYATNIVSAAAGANTVTVSFNGTASYPDIRILEYSGIAVSGALDVTAAATGNSSSASSGAATTTNANDLIFGAVMTSTHATGAGTGFTSRMITSPDGDDAEDEVVITAGSYTATVPIASGKWIMQMVAFRQHP